MKNNHLITRCVLFSFGISYLLTLLFIVVSCSRYFEVFDDQSIAESFVFYLWLGYFWLNAGLYLIWYTRMNNNYLIQRYGQRDGLEFMLWFFPFFNVVSHYKKFKAIGAFYVAKDHSNQNDDISRLVKIWGVSFVCWYLVLLAPLGMDGWFPEELNPRYMENPIWRLIDECVPRLFELIGLIAMGKIVRNIDRFERQAISKKANEVRSS